MPCPAAHTSVSDAYRYLHSLGIIHNAVAPENWAYTNGHLDFLNLELAQIRSADDVPEALKSMVLPNGKQAVLSGFEFKMAALDEMVEVARVCSVLWA